MLDAVEQATSGKDAGHTRSSLWEENQMRATSVESSDALVILQAVAKRHAETMSLIGSGSPPAKEDIDRVVAELDAAYATWREAAFLEPNEKHSPT